jgi:hypothetical protein
MNGRQILAGCARILLAGPVAIGVALLISMTLGFWTISGGNPDILRGISTEQSNSTFIFFSAILAALFFEACLDRSLERVTAIMLTGAVLSAATLVYAAHFGGHPVRDRPPLEARGPAHG